MTSIRSVLPSDLSPLQILYNHLNPKRPQLSEALANQIFEQILNSPNNKIFVCEIDQTLVATSMLGLVPNLMRGGRPHALLENVVTRPSHRRQGYGRAVVKKALDFANAAGAHHVLLMTGRKDTSVRLFYENCGFELGLKAGYVARLHEIEQV